MTSLISGSPRRETCTQLPWPCRRLRSMTRALALVAYTPITAVGSSTSCFGAFLVAVSCVIGTWIAIVWML